MKQMKERLLIYKTDTDLNNGNNTKSTLKNYIKKESILFSYSCACG